MTKEDNVLREFAPISKYRVRLLQDKKGNEVLDIREYVNDESWQGFTRRGIRLTDRAQMNMLRDILSELLGHDGTTAKPEKAKKGGRK
jgi:hypothetical protein